MNTYMSEGVGKRIVDALKKQSEVEIVTPQPSNVIEQENVDIVEEVDLEQTAESNNFSENLIEETTIATEPLFSEPSFMTQPISQPTFNTLGAQASMYSNLSTDFSGLEVPANVAILKQLITQLPGGVSRQAGALVIKQTMEALGISMKSVLQEAQQLQENISLSARECQNNILECKKQINNLEVQVQKYQKQATALNEIISLFVQVN